MRKIESEGIHLVCFKCGIYGHSQDMCSEGPENEVRMGDHAPENGSQTRGNKKGRSQLKDTVPVIRPKIVESFGPWMIAKKNPRRQNQGQRRKEGSNSVRAEKKYKESKGGGSRYAVLEEDYQEEQIDEITNQEKWATNQEVESHNGLSKNNRSKAKKTCCSG